MLGEFIAFLDQNEINITNPSLHFFSTFVRLKIKDIK
jgi:hypothetical protein